MIIGDEGDGKAGGGLSLPPTPPPKKKIGKVFSGKYCVTVNIPCIYFCEKVYFPPKVD